MDLTGTWDLVSSPDFDDEYLHMEVKPYVKLYRVGNRIEGEYHLGLQYGDLDGQMKGDDRAVSVLRGWTRWTRWMAPRRRRWRVAGSFSC